MTKEILPKIEGQPYTYQAYPAWCYGPEGESDVFSSEGDAPAGWKLPDGKTKGGKAAAPVVAATTGTPPVDGEEVDASGAPWDASLHAATKTKTSANLWRMKVGVARPVAEPAVETPPLIDL